MIAIYITVIILIALVIFYKQYYFPKKTLNSYKKMLDGLGYKVKLYKYEPLGCPIITNFKTNQQKKNDAMYDHKYLNPGYDILLYNIMSMPVIEFLSPELCKHMFQPENVYNHFKMTLMIQNIRRSLGNGIPFSEGKQWKRKRGIMNAVFNYDFIVENIPKIIKICQEDMNIIEKQYKQKGKLVLQDGRQIYQMRIFEIFARIFSNTMLECFFGCDSTHQRISDQPISSFVNQLNADISQQNFQIPILVFGAKFAQLGLRQKDRNINERLKILRQFGRSLINKRLAQLQISGPRQKYQDIIEALVLKKSFDKTESSKKVKISKTDADNYDYQQLLQQFCTFFTAGTDTTSHFTQMLVYYIASNKQIQERLRKDIDDIIKTDADITKQNLKKLQYIDWLQNETTRFYGPGNGIFTRIAQNDHFISNIPIKKGMAVSMQPTPTHYNQEFYKNPHQFRPERWESQCNSNPPFSLGGFGGGPRTCIGKHLAMLQSKIAVIKFMKRYKQISLPKQLKQIKMLGRFLYEPQAMDMKLVK